MNEASTQKASLWARIDAWLTEWVGSWNPYDPEKLEKSELKPVVIEESSIRKSTFKMLFLALSLFMVWASFAPLDNGVHMTGNVVIQGHRKAVQHPHGGVVT